MKRILLLLPVILILSACGGKEPQYYVLNPVYGTASTSPKYIALRLGIDEITIPEYLDKPELAIYYTANRSALDENHQWAEELKYNVRRVIKTNLSTFLPGAIVENAPWDIKFKPNYQLDVDISQFNVNIDGKSVLAAEYVIYHDNAPLKKYRVFYSEIIPVVNAATIVCSMNKNLTLLTRHIAAHMPH